MSRIGKKPISLSSSVQVDIKSDSVKMKGPKGEIEQKYHPLMKVELDEENKAIVVTRPDDLKESRALHGLVRALINNAVTGVTEGFEKTLKIIGTGYNVKLMGKHMDLQVGYCLPKKVMIPENINVEVPNPTQIIIKGCDRQAVGQFAANVRAIRPPDSYKGKGIRYENEVVKLKAGKSFGS